MKPQSSTKLDRIRKHLLRLLAQATRRITNHDEHIRHLLAKDRQRDTEIANLRRDLNRMRDRVERMDDE